MNDTGLDVDYQALDDLNGDVNGPTPAGFGLGGNDGRDAVQTPGDILDAATGPQLPMGDGTTPYDIEARALNAAPGPAQHPLTTEQRFFQDQNPNGGSFSHRGNGNMTVEQQAFQDAYPTGGSFNANGQPTGGALPMGTSPGMAPSPSGTNNFIQPLLNEKNPVGATLPMGASGGDLSADQRLVKDASGNVVGVRSQNGYYDPAFQSTSHMLDNYQQGDHMAGTVDALRILAAMGNENAKKVLGAEQATGSNVMSSGLEANWAQRHNAEISNSLSGGAFGGNQAARSNLAGQEVEVNQNPLSGSQAFPEATKMMQALEKLPDVDPNSVKMDSSGNVVFTDKSGIRHIPMNEWNDWLPVIEARLAASTAAPEPGGGGGGGRGPRVGNGPPNNGPKGPGPYEYQGQTAPYDENQGTFASVATGKQIPTAPLPVAGGDIQIPTQSRRAPRAY